MFSEDLLFELNEYELIDIAKGINISSTIIGTPPKKKTKRTLSYDVFTAINAMPDPIKLATIRNITTTGRLVFTAFRTISRKATADYKLPKNYTEFKDNINNFRFFMPDKIDDMIAGYYVLIPNNSNHVILIKKDFGNDIGYASALSMAKSVCIDMQIDPLFKQDIVSNIFAKVANSRLNTKISLSQKINKKFRIFYDQHKCDGEFLTISTKIASGRPRIGKIITRLSSIDQNDVDSLVKSKKINSLASTPDIINYSIVSTPKCVRDTLVNITINILTDNIKGNSSPLRYKLSIYREEIKVLTVDTNFNDIKGIIDIILLIH